MNPIKSILVGIDYSENSQNALREASRIANWNDAKLECLHILEEEIVDVFRGGDEVFDERAMVEHAQSRLERFVAETLGAGHEITCKIQVGRPFAEIIAAIDFTHPDLLVLGSHGLASHDPGHVGVLAKRCVRRAPVNVLLVQERQHDPFASIVACVDFSENSISAAHRAAEIAAQDHAGLELLHIYRNAINAARDEGGFGPALPEVDPTEDIKKLRHKLEALSQELGSTYDGCEIRVNVEDWNVVSRGIVGRLEKVKADLVVLGTRGRSKLKGILIGTTAERLIYRVPCSALAVKQ